MDNNILERLARLEERVLSAKNDLENIIDTLDRIDARLDSHMEGCEKRMGPLEARVNGLLWLAGIIGSSVVSLFVKGCCV